MSTVAIPSNVEQKPPVPPQQTAAASAALRPAKEQEYNRLGLDYRRPMPWPKVRGIVIDYHTHLVAARHAKTWFEAYHHYGIDACVTMAPLEEAVVLAREWPGRLRFIAVPAWQNPSIDDWRRRIDAFYNMGSRIIKFHMAPSTMALRNVRLDSPAIRSIIRDAVARGMAIMTHVGDPDTWYGEKYADASKYGTRDEHYKMWEGVMSEYRDHPWMAAHMGGNPENLERLQDLLDRFPNLSLDNGATKWIVRELSRRRDAARDFCIRNADRILFGTDLVSGDDRGFDFLSSRIWAHRKLWETAYAGPSNIYDPDCAADQQPQLRGLALPDEVLQKMYHDNAVKFLARVGMGFE